MALLSRLDIAQPTEADVRSVAIVLLARSPLDDTIDHIASILGMPKTAVKPAVTLAMTTPLPGWSGPNGAMEQTISHEAVYRAMYIVNAVNRINFDIEGHAPIRQTLSKERDFYLHSKSAQADRISKAKLVDLAAAKYGRKLGWYAIPDRHISTVCVKANRKNFMVDRRPAIGYPGQVHVGCRCRPGPPFNTTATVYSIGLER